MPNAIEADKKPCHSDVNAHYSSHEMHAEIAPAAHVFNRRRHGLVMHFPFARSDARAPPPIGKNLILGGTTDAIHVMTSFS